LTLIYQIRFYPEQGHRLSPYDFLMKLKTPGERARVVRHLETICDLYPQYWQEHVEIKLIEEDLYQLTSGSIRSYICIDKHTLVVVYMCRKVSNELKPIDKKRAIGNMVRYFKEE